MGLPPPDHDPSEVRDLADRILSEARFDRPSKPLIERIQDWFAERIGDVVGTLVGSGAGTLVAWMLLLGAIGFVIYLVVRHGGGVSIDRPVNGEVPAMIELSRSPAEWRAEAEALEAAGRWKEGLRCRHRALVSELVHRGAIPDQAGRTAGEYVRDVAGAMPHAAPAMAAATELFEAAWYGAATTGASEADRFRALERDVLAAGLLQEERV